MFKLKVMLVFCLFMFCFGNLSNILAFDEPETLVLSEKKASPSISKISSIKNNLHKNKLNSNDNLNVDYKVSLTISPSVITIRDLKKDNNKEIKIKVSNFSTKPQTIEVIPSNGLTIKDNVFELTSNGSKEVILNLNVSSENITDSHQEHIYFKTITPNQDKGIILKSNIYFEVE